MLGGYSIAAMTERLSNGQNILEKSLIDAHALIKARKIFKGVEIKTYCATEVVKMPFTAMS
jgi:carbonic anhydrase/acetyltransferase-like protein (isoleucine patch superfamily)